MKFYITAILAAILATLTISNLYTNSEQQQTKEQLSLDTNEQIISLSDETIKQESEIEFSQSKTHNKTVQKTHQNPEQKSATDAPMTEAPGANKDAQFAQYLTELENQNYQHVSAFHDLVIYCRSLPKDDAEMTEWEAKHAGQDNVDIDFMRNEVNSCSTVKSYTYNELRNMYRAGHDQGSIDASFALAKLIPYESEEKITLLSRSAARYADAHTMLADRAMENSELLSAKERYFWMMTHPQGLMFGEEFNSVLLDVEAQLSNSEKETLQHLINQWSETASDNKNVLIENLLSFIEKQEKDSQNSYTLNVW